MARKSRKKNASGAEAGITIDPNGTDSTIDGSSTALVRAAVNAADSLPTDLFINRELSWLDFNRRVLAEADDPHVPLLERVKFLSITASNMDEFFMIRVAGVKRKIAAGMGEPGGDGRTPTQQYTAIHLSVQQLIDEQTRLYHEELLPALRNAGIRITDVASLSAAELAAVEEMFQRDVFPVLTPQAIDRARRFPHISNESLNLIVVLQSASDRRFARIKIPAVLPRLVRVPSPDGVTGATDREVTYVWLEDLVEAHVEQLFPGNRSVSSYTFEITRDSDIEFDEDDEESPDLLSVMRELLSERTFGSVVRLLVEERMPEEVRAWLLDQLATTERELYVAPRPLAVEDLRELLRLDRPELKDPPFTPAPLSLAFGPATAESGDEAWGAEQIFATLRQRDVLVHHPYQSFNAVAEFLKAAATDPDVVAIKQTLYRIGRDSPLIPALIEARDDDTQVAVLVELKARFDEESNISWAQQLEQYGVHVAYGLAGLKTHCKLTLVVRREENRLRRYVHMATGNYNATTARLYEDLGLLTSREDVSQDISELFNVLTGYSEQTEYRKLLVAPVALRDRLLALIEREIDRHQLDGGGKLTFKMNALVDREIIDSLYRASQAGVSIDLIVRGACCLRPGVPGWSENIRVRSIIGRFLEHSRIYAFGDTAADPLYMGSADLMERNFDRRIEVIFPVEDAKIKQHIRDVILPAYQRDTDNAWLLNADTSWSHVVPMADEIPFDVQQFFLEFYSQNGVAGEPRWVAAD